MSPLHKALSVRLEKLSWRYLGEGNRHLVLALDSGRVLRLHKSAVSAETLRASIEFVSKVMWPLLVNERVGECEQLITLDDDELAQLNDSLVDLRPLERKGKLICCNMGTIAPNYTLVSSSTDASFCVEIKPKFGFMQEELRNYGKCSYCMKQYLKLTSNQITRIGDYCPLDLFSGNHTRMLRSLLNLTKDPQNNFKFFKNGQTIFGESSSSKLFEHILKEHSPFKELKSFFKFIVDILLSGQGHGNCLRSVWTPVNENVQTQGCDESKVPINSNCVLHRILSLQKLWLKDNSYIKVVPKNDYDYVRPLLNVVDENSVDFSVGTDRERLLEKFEPLWRCMLAVVARDCSIMISFSESPDRADAVLVDGHHYGYNVAVTDLEPKPTSAMMKRNQVDADMIKAFCEVTLCRIQPHSETRAKQLGAWQNLIVDYLKRNKQFTIDIKEAQNSELFNNTAIKRKLSAESILLVLEEMGRCGHAAPTDKSRAVWEVYWHSLEEWGNLLYGWACQNGVNNTVCTLYELREGEHTKDEEFHELDMNILVKALKTLEVKGKCELIELDDSQGVKFF